MKVLVIGAAGGFGGAMARSLLQRGHAVRALQRPGGRTPDLAGAEVVTGDALDPSALARAARGVDVIVFGFHAPYPKWDPICVDAIRVTAQVAAAAGATVAFPGNVYGYGPDFDEPLGEDASRDAPTKKGAIRNQMEDVLAAATRRGARALVVRAGDYLDAHCENTWLEEMTKRALEGGAIVDPGEPGVPHAWAFLPDVAEATVRLLERRASLAPFEVVHFAGYSVQSVEMVDAIRQALGNPSLRVSKMPWWLLRGMGPFVPLIREVLEMRYLFQQPVLLDETRLLRLLPDRQRTPLPEAVERSLRGIAARKGIAWPEARVAA